MKTHDAIFDEARDAWHSGASFRSTRSRLLRNVYGDQWSDHVLTADGRIVSEHRKAVEEGLKPMTNNLLRSLVKTVVGRFRYNLLGETSDPDGSLAAFRSLNQVDELDARAIEEFLISGYAAQRILCERRGGGLGVWVENVRPDRLFFNRFSDPRGCDLRLVGMLADMSLGEVKLRFAHGSARRCAEIDRIYSECRRLHTPFASVSASDEVTDFLSASDPSLCRVIEVWSFDIDPSEPSLDPHWHCRFFAPNGALLDETRSCLPDGSQPFIVRLYPMTDGAVHPFIEDLVSQQKHINSLITTIDHILASSAKGVLLFPSDCLLPGCDMVMAANLWNRPGAVIPINPAASRLPQEVTSTGHSEGAAKLLESELKMFQSISGVTSALQGRVDGANTSASLYESHVYNSAIALLDVYETFNSFRSSRDRIARMFIKEFLQ